jgi:hypothetical protein
MLLSWCSVAFPPSNCHGVEGIPTPITHESNNKSFACMHTRFLIFKFFLGVNFHHLATEKKSNVTHKNVICEKECTKINQIQERFFL